MTESSKLRFGRECSGSVVSSAFSVLHSFELLAADRLWMLLLVFPKTMFYNLDITKTETESLEKGKCYTLHNAVNELRLETSHMCIL